MHIRVWMGSGGQVSSLTGQLLTEDSDSYLNTGPSHAWSHRLAQVFCTHTLDVLVPQTMWNPKLWYPLKGEDGSPRSIMLGGKCWERVTQDAADPSPVTGKKGVGRDWKGNHAWEIFLSCFCLCFFQFYHFFFLPSLFFSSPPLIHLFSFTSYFLLSLSFLLPCSDLSFTTCPR